MHSPRLARNTGLNAGGYGIITKGYEELNAVVILRPVFRYYTNKWFFISPVYNFKLVSIYNDDLLIDSEEFSTCSMQYFGLSVGANIKPLKFIGLSLAPGALLQHYSRKGNQDRKWNHFAVSADIGCKLYLREYLALGIMYYFAFDVFNGSEHPDAGLTLGVTCYL